MAVVAGEGRNGSAAMVWESSVPSNHCYVAQRVPVEGGRRYRFGARVKIDSTANDIHRDPSRRIRVELDWFGADRKLLGQYCPPVVAHNEANADGWYKFEGVCPPLPGTPAFGSIVLYFVRGSTGRVRFDDVQFEPLSEVPVGSMFSSAYRDEAVSGRVDLGVFLTVNEARHPLKGLRAEFSYLAVDDKTKTVPADSFDAEYASVRIPVAAFATGTHPVVFRLWEGQNLLGTVQRPFTRLTASSTRRVRVDECGRLLVDGKPFFPIGMYYEPGNHHKEMFANYRKGPYNCICPYHGSHFPSHELLDECAAAGLKVVADLKGAVSGDRWPRADCDTPEKAMRTAAAFADSVKGHPALLAYCTLDETPLHRADRVRELYDVLSTRDPDHPVLAVLDNPAHARDHRNAYDVIAVDAYPIGSPWRPAISKCGEMGDAAIAATRGSCSFWFVPQSFAWEQYKGRAPTEEEYRNMVWQGIAAGANAILSFSYATYSAWRDPESYKGYERVLSDVKAKTPLLLSLPGPKLVHAPKGAGARVWKTAEGDVTLYVNRTSVPVTGEFRFGDGRAETIALKPLEVLFRKSTLAKEEIRGRTWDRLSETGGTRPRSSPSTDEFHVLSPGEMRQFAGRQIPLCMIGDSITWAEVGDAWRKWLVREMPMLAFVGTHTARYGYSHAGEGGNSTYGVLKRLDDRTRIPDCPYYHLMIGINDSSAAKCADDVPRVASNTVNAIWRIVDGLLARPTTRKVFLASILPARVASRPFRDVSGSAANELMRAEVGRRYPADRVVWVEYEKPLRRNLDGWLGKKGDFLHPRDPGYRKLAEMLAPVLKRECGSASTSGTSAKHGVAVENLWDEQANRSRPLLPGWYVASFSAGRATGKLKVRLRNRTSVPKSSYDKAFTVGIANGGRGEFEFMTGYEGYGYAISPFELEVTDEKGVAVTVSNVQVEKMRPSRSASRFGRGRFIDSTSPVCTGEMLEPVDREL